MNAVEPTISVVVATFNRAARLERAIEALRAQQDPGVPFELVVVDDCSSDGTAALLAAERDRDGIPVRTLRTHSNSGPAAAREAGRRAARGRVIAFTDDDCRPSPGWLAAGYRALGEDPMRIVQGRTLPDPTDADRRGPFSRTIDVSGPDPAFHTCNIFYGRELLERIDGFDTESFSHGAEDTDLAWRALAAGAHASYEPEALVHHEIADLGPLGKLRVALRWTDAMAAFVRHPELRRSMFHSRLFWKPTHALLARALLAAIPAGPRRGLPSVLAWALRLWLVFPYARALWARGRLEGGGPLLAPYFLLHDLLEMFTVLRAAIRFRSPML